MAGDVDYMLRVVVPDIAGYDAFCKKLITVPLKNVTSRFAMEKIKLSTALPVHAPQRPSSHKIRRARDLVDARDRIHLVAHRQRAGDVYRPPA